MDNVWQRLKDGLLLLFGLILLVVLLPFNLGGQLAGAIKRLLGNGGGADDSGADYTEASGHLDDAGGSIEEAQGAIGDISEGVDGSIELNQSAQSDNRTVADILERIRKRGEGKKGS